MNCLIISTSFTLQPVLASIWNAPVGYQKERLSLFWQSGQGRWEEALCTYTFTLPGCFPLLCLRTSTALFIFICKSIFAWRKYRCQSFPPSLPLHHWLCWQLQSDCNLPGQMGSILHSRGESPPTNILQGVWSIGWVISWRRDENQGH